MAGKVKKRIIANTTHDIMVTIPLLPSEVSSIRPPSASDITVVNTDA